jgi:hypothetical protein
VDVAELALVDDGGDDEGTGEETVDVSVGDEVLDGEGVGSAA